MALACSFGREKSRAGISPNTAEFSRKRPLCRALSLDCAADARAMQRILALLNANTNERRDPFPDRTRQFRTRLWNVACYLYNVKPREWFCILGLNRPATPESAIQKRLAVGFRELNELQLAAKSGRDRQRSESMAVRIVWRELLDLELQDVDEQIERIVAQAGY